MSDAPPDPEGDQADLVLSWLRVVAATAYVPRSSTEVHALLASLLRRLTEALTATPPDVVVGLRVGELMVEGALTGETTLEGSLGVLADGLADAGFGARPVARLLAYVAAGYAAALRKRTLAQQENMKLALLTAKQRAERDRRATESRFREVFDASAVGIAITELDGTFVETNPALATILGRPTEDLRYRTLAEFIADEDEPPLAVGEADRRRVVRPGGDTAWVYLTTSMLRDDSGVARYRVTMVQDLSELQLLGNQLSHQSLHDALTGLPNRLHFESRLEAMHAQAPPHRPLTLLCLDLDAFSLVNTTYGHATGDRVLRTTANRLTSAVAGRQALVARVGGDEFAVLIAHDTAPPPVSTLVTALLAELSEPDYDAGVGLAVSATVGAVRRTPAEMSSAELFRAADAAHRYARSLGRHQWAEFDGHADRATRKVGTLATGLPAAWENGELRVAYQPVVRLSDLVPVRVRALVHLPTDRDTAELAESTGLSVPLGPWLLAQSGTHLPRWRTLFGPVAEEGEAVHRVLLSGLQSADGDLSATVNDVLTSTCVPTGALEIGLDTAAVLTGRGDAQDNLRTLSDIGVVTALHGFTGGPREIAMVERFGVRTVLLADPFEGWRPDWLPREAVPVRATLELIAALRSVGASVGVLGVRDHAEATWWAEQGVRTAEGPAFGGPGGVGDITGR
ncbi:diguanylate cyclase domain-containing protein [Actinokineospora diospyrosa]|uniref:PAS domain S-box-containing protein/diguanylate cyclase (GGDEF) domain-containing protein n=1 Tax=Actinokineospora diospyrosa TaxID=103728 RepID=A0ABT1I7P3_9PSEU|nr:diguanylate cyclase [Actinokineospora diospyrosa]MCP2268644.1 PAS domain S-box-containing protein/diguanylate cyclase (GGDEF) domain-containing protein [Actinokineospora diospyrosa]